MHRYIVLVEWRERHDARGFEPIHYDAGKYELREKVDRGALTILSNFVALPGGVVRLIGSSRLLFISWQSGRWVVWGIIGIVI